MTKLSYSRNGQDYTLDTTALPQAALDYLLQYGFSQSLQDSIAGRAKAVREEMLARPENAPADWTPPSETEIAEMVSDDAHGTLLKRLDAIRNGSVATRGPAAPRDETAGIVREILLSIAKAKGVKLPKADSEEYAKMAGRVREAKAEYIAAELERRKNAVAEIELDL